MALVTDLEKLAIAHLDDARALLAAGRFDGAVHLVGYAVEVALKVRICKSLAWSEFPDKGHEYRSFLVHDLDILLHMSGKEEEVRTPLVVEWSDVSDWNPEVRYAPPGHAIASDTERMLESAAKVLDVLL